MGRRFSGDVKRVESLIFFGIFFSEFLFPLNTEDLAEKFLCTRHWSSVHLMFTREEKIQFKARETVSPWQAQML